MNLRRRSSSRKGFVLVSVLMISTVLISCASAFMWFARTNARTVAGERVSLSSRSMAHVLASSVMNILHTIGEHAEADSPIQKWYQPVVITFDDLGVWTVHAVPLDDKIPLRSLFLPDGNTMRREFADIWSEMWEKLGRRELEHVVLDFMDKNTRPRVGGAEHDWYLNRPPYDLSELAMMSNDIPPSFLPELAKYMTLYSDGRINLNTSPAEVLELLPGLSNITTTLIHARNQEPLTSLNDIANMPGAGSRTATLLTNIAAFKSRYCSLAITGNTQYHVIFDKQTRHIVRIEEL